MEPTSLWLWAGFNLFVLAMLALDLGIFHRKAHEVSMQRGRASGARSGSLSPWSSTSASGTSVGPQPGTRVPHRLPDREVAQRRQHLRLRADLRLLRGPRRSTSTGCCSGASSARWSCAAVFILGRRGADRALPLDHLHLRRVPGLHRHQDGLRAGTGARPGAEPADPAGPAAHAGDRRATEGQRFFVREGGRRVATPLFLVLVMVETTDLVFAVDSIPAIFAVTPDPFIVFTSNVFAILGLRSLYFLLAGVMRQVPLPEARPGRDPGLRRREDAAGRLAARSRRGSRSA